MNIETTMNNIVSRATMYERHTVHKTLFTDVSNTIEYVLNSYWHREQELSNFDSNYSLAVGCSHTFGIGVNKPWPSYFTNTYNAGIPGATIYDMIDVAIDIYDIKPFKNLMMFVPHGERMIVYDNKKQVALMPYSDVYEAYKNIDINTKMYYNKRSTEFLKLWCKSNNISLSMINMNSIKFLKTYKKLIVDKAADSLHYGENTHKNFAGLFYAKPQD